MGFSGHGLAVCYPEHSENDINLIEIHSVVSMQTRIWRILSST